MTEQIKEAISLVNDFKKDGWDMTKWKEVDSAIDILLTLAQSYLSASGELPKELKYDTIEDYVNQRYVDGANAMRKDFLLALMKRCEVDRLAKIIHSKNDMCVSDKVSLKDLEYAIVIREHILGGKE